ncbi:hypothetical protein AAIP36_000463 [Flavobacterium psychrophilum]
MKKIFYTLCALSLLLISCSKDDTTVATAPENTTTNILPKKIIEERVTGILTYDGNKLLAVTYPYKKTVFTYTGDLVTKIISYSNNATSQITDYTYDNGKLKIIDLNEIDSPSTNKTVLTYNTDGTITYIRTAKNKQTGIETPEHSEKETFLNGNIVKKEITAGTHNSFIYTYEYDTKNNATKNILGFNKLLDAEMSNANNLVKETTVQIGSTQTTRTTTNQYLYNAQDYPIAQKKYDETNVLKRTTTFEY